MIAVRKALAAAFGAVALPARSRRRALVAWAAPVHAQSSAGFTGFGRGSNGTAALSRARDDARRQIAAAGLDLTQRTTATRNYNDVRVQRLRRRLGGPEHWECIV